MDENEDIKEAIKELEEISGDEELRRMAELRIKAIRDEQAAISLATKKGLEQGLKQGLEQGEEHGAKEKTIEIAKKMLKEKMNLETIAKITGLSIEEIKKLT